MSDVDRNCLLGRKVGGDRTDLAGMCHKCSVRIAGTERTLQPVSSG